MADSRLPKNTSHELDSAVESAIFEALCASNTDRLKTLVKSLHYADVADLLERMSPNQRDILVEAIRDVFNPDILSELDNAVLDDVMAVLGPKGVAAAVSEMESNDAVEVVKDLDEEDRQLVLDAISPADRSLIEESLTYPEDSAGRLMQREVASAPERWTVGETIDFLRHSAADKDCALPDVFYNIFIVDQDRHPLGVLSLSRLLRSKREERVFDLMNREIKLIPATMDQEEVAFLFSQRDLVTAGVVDEANRLIGSITIDDVVDVIHEEHEEDIMRLGGVQEDDLYDAVMVTSRLRFTWLLVNLLTALLASLVISMFEVALNQIIALAVLMPIVASMGGNAGTQTMTVTVRALAMKELTATNAMRIIGKEFMVGSLNGVMFAIIIGVVAWLWYSDPGLGGVIAMAMIANLIAAGVAGTIIPLVLERTGLDPAVGSSVILTTVTDVVGFATFLGLASWLLL